MFVLEVATVEVLHLLLHLPLLLLPLHLTASYRPIQLQTIVGVIFPGQPPRAQCLISMLNMNFYSFFGFFTFSFYFDILLRILFPFVPFRTNSALVVPACHAHLYSNMPAYSICYTNKLVLTDTPREAYVTI